MKRFAIAGCGHIHTPWFTNMLGARKDIEIAGAWDQNDPARAARCVKQLGGKVCESDSDIWNDRSIDAIVVLSETNLHREIVMKASKAGKHMFVEKPLGVNAMDANAMAAEISKSGVIFQTGYFMRGIPAHQFLKKQVETGSFGKITKMRHSNCHAGALEGWFDKDFCWMTQPDISGCGAFGDLATHSLDIVMWLLGKPAYATASIHTVNCRYGKECDESGEGMLLFPSGAVATIAGAWTDVENPVTCEIYGTEGHALICRGELFFTSSRVAGADGKAPWTDLPVEWPHALNMFVDAVISGDASKLVAPREAASRNTVMDVMYLSSKEKRWVEISF